MNGEHHQKHNVFCPLYGVNKGVIAAALPGRDREELIDWRDCTCKPTTNVQQAAEQSFAGIHKAE